MDLQFWMGGGGKEGLALQQICQTCWWMFRGGSFSLLVLLLTMEESSFYVSFRIRVALKMQLIVTLKSLFICMRLQWNVLTVAAEVVLQKISFFFSPFFPLGNLNIQLVHTLHHFSRFNFECLRRFEGSRQRRLPHSCDFVTLWLPSAGEEQVALSSHPPLVIILNRVNLQVRC